MKRIISGVVVALLVLTMSGVARAEEGVEVEAGMKLWMNKWKNADPARSTLTSDDMILVGPVVEAKLPNHVFVEASTMIAISDTKVNDDSTSQTYKLSRSDMDMAAGYMFLHNVGAFVGYRSSTIKDKDRAYDATSYGPVLGIRGSVPVHEAVELFGKVTYLLTKLKEESPTGTATQNAPGWIAEAGVKYEFSKKISGSFGYQYETTKTKDTSVKDTFTGFTLGAMYAF
jgi:opacity protein-like surface antigen